MMAGAGPAGEPGEPAEPVEHYLDEVYDQLRGPARHARRVLAETEAHLRDAVDARVAQGADRADAEREAVAAFGPAREFSRACNSVSARERAWGFIHDVRAPAVFLTGVGSLAIGLSGVIDRILQAAFGSDFVFGDPPGTTYSASDCQYWMSIHPHASSCTQAYVAEATADGLAQRFAVGIVGVLILAAFFWWSRRRGRAVLRARTFTTTVAASVFGTAGLLLTGYGIDRAVVFGAHGPGQYVSAGGIALAIALFGIVVLSRSWRSERSEHAGLAASA